MTPIPKLSVCVVTYNQERYIRECLQGIVDQKTDFAFEVIVADDCSTDNTPQIVREFEVRYPKTVKAVLRSVNIGGTRNFIDVHNLAKGTYVAHIDGDDLMLPGKLQKQADFLDANPDFSVVWHRVNLFNDDGDFFPGENFDLSSYPEGVVTLEHALRLGSVAAHSSIMYREGARKTRQSELELLDLFFTWEYLSAGKGKILDDVLGSYRVSARGSAQSKSTTNVAKLVARHARDYLLLMPEQRRNIFVYALITFLVDLKNRRKTAWDFGKLAVQSASFVPPSLIRQTIFEMRRLPPLGPAGNVLLRRLSNTT